MFISKSVWVRKTWNLFLFRNTCSMICYSKQSKEHCLPSSDSSETHMRVRFAACILGSCFPRCLISVCNVFISLSARFVSLCLLLLSISLSPPLSFGFCLFWVSRLLLFWFDFWSFLCRCVVFAFFWLFHTYVSTGHSVWLWTYFWFAVRFSLLFWLLL